MQPELPQTYYLDNVLTLFGHVERLYTDLLDAELLAFLRQFGALPEDAQKLCVRLLNRRGDYFRLGKLEYAEIASLETAAGMLADAGLIEIDNGIEREDLLTLYTRAELIAASSEPSAYARLRRGELEARLLEDGAQEYFDRLRSEDSLLRLTCGEHYLRCQMLFFGNLSQSMTDFVLSDLGLYRYENYVIDAEHRPYRNRDEIEQHWLIYRLESLFESAERSDPAELVEIGQSIPRDIDRRAPAWRKSERLRYEIARQLERIGATDAALELYRECSLPPCRERIVRIRDKQGKHREALAICHAILADPLEESEQQFAAAFAARISRRHDLDLALAAVEALDDAPPAPVLDLELAPADSVELAVAEYFHAPGKGEFCYYLENSLFNGVLGLLIWEAVFAPLPGAFFNPFQYRPSDFYAHDFCDNRERLLRKIFDSLTSNQDIWRIVSERWRQKQGLMNPLVNWQYLDLDIISLALQRIEHGHWRAIFERILEDLRNNRSGFPDLLHFPAAGGYCLIEVKGPGDSLQKNQQRWMHYFHRHGIPHLLARVSWRSE